MLDFLFGTLMTTVLLILIGYAIMGTFGSVIQAWAIGLTILGLISLSLSLGG